jgi:hypothetical protein
MKKRLKRKKGKLQSLKKTSKRADPLIQEMRKEKVVIARA